MDSGDNVLFNLFLISLFIVLFYLLILSYVLITSGHAPKGLFEYRMARSISAALVGFVLAISGCLLQTVYRNPLVDHYILGIGGGALFFTYISIIVFGYIGFTLISIFAVIGGLLALLLTVRLAEAISGSDVSYVLAGISVTTLFSGLSLLASYFAIARYRIAGILLLGSFVTSNLYMTIQLLAPTGLVIIGYALLARKLNVILLGDENAIQLGVDPRKTRLLSTMIAGVSASIVVSLYGLIGFIGLVSPHISRLLLKTSDNRVVIPLSGLVGSVLLYTTDQLSRQIVSPVYGEVPVGALVSVVGAPFFMYLLIKRFAGRAI